MPAPRGEAGENKQRPYSAPGAQISLPRRPGSSERKSLHERGLTGVFLVREAATARRDARPAGWWREKRAWRARQGGRGRAGKPRPPGRSRPDLTALGQHRSCSTCRARRVSSSAGRPSVPARSGLSWWGSRTTKLPRSGRGVAGQHGAGPTANQRLVAGGAGAPASRNCLRNTIGTRRPERRPQRARRSRGSRRRSPGAVQRGGAGAPGDGELQHGGLLDLLDRAPRARGGRSDSARPTTTVTPGGRLEAPPGQGHRHVDARQQLGEAINLPARRSPMALSTNR